MNILTNKNVVILGLGNHGGGLSSTRFALHSNASNISIMDRAGARAIEMMLKPLATDRHRIDILPYDKTLLSQADIVIKNPAIPRHADILKDIHHIETDISLYYQTQQTPTMMITGTKGKSSIATALYNMLSNTACFSAKSTSATIVLSGNITNSPLNIVLEKQSPKKIILELSSFQLGDLVLVSPLPYQYMETMILTNIMPDHQNYYDSMQSYAADKLLPFKHLSHTATAILPFPMAFSQKTKQQQNIQMKDEMIVYSAYGNTITLPAQQCYFHSQTPLPFEYAGTYYTDEGLWGKAHNTNNAQLLIQKKDIPEHIPLQNISIILAVFLPTLLQKAIPNTKTPPHPYESIPNNKQAWNDIFSIAHRKEYLGSIKGISFYNDSAATIPQAMQLHNFSEHTIHLIAGGTDKNIPPDDFITAIKNTPDKTILLYLLEGSYTKKIIPKLQSLETPFFGPFSCLRDAFHTAFEQSKKSDIILLSPGCASFEMFEHEFARGDAFKHLLQALTQTLVRHSP